MPLQGQSLRISNTTGGESAKAYESGGDCEECEIEVGMAFVSDGKAPEPVEPGDGALDDPTMASEFLRGFDASSCNARFDASHSQIATASSVVVALVGVQFVRPAARTPARSAQARDGVDDVVERLAAVNVGACQGAVKLTGDSGFCGNLGR